MNRAIALLPAVALVLAACGTDSGTATTTTNAPVFTGTLHRSGGFAGLDETWRLESDGTVLGPDGYVGSADPDAVAALIAAADAAGFFQLEDEYLPADQCCDRFLYELTLSRGDDTHTVITLDGADAPESLFRLIQDFLTAVHPDA